MAGFRQDPIQLINLVADNLRDRYPDSFSILKELLQNADDAGAKEVHIGMSAGLHRAEHPLLQGPALFLLNDGPFSRRDYEAIQSFGLNSKAEDSDTIGKFGLGMKSVFHLCEAFFFRANSNGYRCEEVLNPWSGATEGPVKSLHGDWDELEDADFRAIEEEVANATGRMPLSSHPVNFLLWLPLRCRAHGRLLDGRASGFIIDEFPGDEVPALPFLSDSSVGSRLASLLPLLRSVCCVRVWLPETKDRGWALRHESTLTDDAQRPSRDLSHSATSIRGVVAVTGTDSARDVRFAGCQSYEWTSDLQRLRDHEYWPSSWVRNELGVSSRVPDKAEPHSAAVFDRVIGDDPGTLTIRWAVFLPVETGHEEVPLGSAATECRYTLTLHGYFFVDAGRQRIGGVESGMSNSPESGPADERELRTRWNAELAEAGTLRHVIPALARFVDGTDLPDTEITVLTAGIQRSALWKRHVGAITANHAWVCRMDASGAIWTIISSRCDTLPLPSPPRTDPARPWRVFPTLDDVAGERMLIEHGAPHTLGSRARWRRSPPVIPNRGSTNSCPGTSTPRQAEESRWCTRTAYFRPSHNAGDRVGRHSCCHLQSRGTSGVVSDLR